jgi:hypothetical protein
LIKKPVENKKAISKDIYVKTTANKLDTINNKLKFFKYPISFTPIFRIKSKEKELLLTKKSPFQQNGVN